MSAVRARNWIVWIAASIAILFVVFNLSSAPGGFAPLTASGGFKENGEYSSVPAAPIVGRRYGSWSGSDAHTGTLTSAPFRLGLGIQLTASGYPSHAGQIIQLVRTDTSQAYDLHLEDAGEAWRTFVVPVPLNWVGQRVRLVATDGATGFQGWFGIADVRRASALSVVSSDARCQLLLVTLAAFALFVPALGVAAAACRRCGLSDLFIFGIAFVVLGVAAEADFFLTMVNTSAAQVACIIALSAGCIVTARDMLSPARGARWRRADTLMPFVMTLSAVVFYSATIALTVNPNAPAANLLPLFSLPSDNNVPHILADHIAAHAPPEPFMGDWLSSDRPPLQAGFDLIVRTIAPTVSDPYLRYQGLGFLLQCSVFGLIFTLCRVCGTRLLPSLGVVALALFSGFFLVNTIYVWPKLLSTTYLGLALAIGLCPGQRTRLQALLIGLCTGLAMLSHSGVAFTIPALVVALAVKERLHSLKTVALALAAFLVLALPWTWYQHSYDPPGDRLLKWHLAGQVAVTARPFKDVLIDAYSSVPPATIVENKLSNVRVLWGDPLSNTWDREFFFVHYTVGALLLPFIAAVLLMPMRRFRSSGTFAWLAVGGLAFWCLAMYGPGTTVVHQGSYLNIALMFVAGGMIAIAWWPLFGIVLAAQIYDYVHTYLSPFAVSEFFTAGGVLAFTSCLLLAALIAIVVRRLTMEEPLADFRGRSVSVGSSA